MMFNILLINLLSTINWAVRRLYKTKLNSRQRCTACLWYYCSCGLQSSSTTLFFYYTCNIML